jgi:inosine-uridine nucleoside N-ribohydrolase
VGAQQPWVCDYDLEKYPGKVHKDGVQAMIDTVRESPRPITVIAIGPVPNLAEALRRDPKLADRARLVVMGGSVDTKYGGKPGRCAEYNVMADAKAAQVAYGAGWDVTMTPLDTAGVVQLTGTPYARVRDADNPLARALMENYRIWARKHRGADPDRRSSILFDTVAIYLAFDQRLCQMRDIRLRVTDAGITQPDLDGKRTRVAMHWNDLDAFHDFVAGRIAGFR